MTKEEAEAIIRGFVTNEVTVSFFCALKGATLAIYPDEIAIGISVTNEIKKDEPLAALKCPGCEYFNIEEVTDEVVHDCDTGIYLTIDGGERELEEAIWEFTDRDDLEERKERIIEELIDDWEDRNENAGR
jgi:hypothetical protein